MSTKLEATIEDLARLSDGRKAELVNGEIAFMSPTGGLPSYAALRVAVSFEAYEDKTGWGHAFGDNAGFVVDLPHRKSFSPDAAYFVGELTMEFVTGAPLVAVEVRSNEDYGKAAERKIAAKRTEYFAAGTKVVFDIDLQGEDVVRAYYASQPKAPNVFRRGQQFDCEPVLPGWSMPVDKLFPPAHGS